MRFSKCTVLICYFVAQDYDIQAKEFYYFFFFKYSWGQNKKAHSNQRHVNLVLCCRSAWLKVLMRESSADAVSIDL